MKPDWLERVGGVIAIALIVVCLTFMGLGMIGLVRDTYSRESSSRVQFLENRVRLLEKKNRLLTVRKEQAERVEVAAVRLVDLMFLWLGVRR